MRVVLPWRFLTDTANIPSDADSIGSSYSSSQTWGSPRSFDRTQEYQDAMIQHNPDYGIWAAASASL